MLLLIENNLEESKYSKNPNQSNIQTGQLNPKMKQNSDGEYFYDYKSDEED